MRRRRIWLSSWLPIAAVLLSACQQPEPTRFEPPRVLEESPYVETGDFGAIQRHGQLRLLMVRRPDAVTHLPRAGSPVNAQLQAAARFARSVGLEPVVVLVDRFDQLIPALTEGRGDLIVANLPITGRHRERIRFTVALDRSRQMLVARSDDPIETPEDLEDRAITVGFDSRFWHAAKRLQEHYPGLELNSLPALSTARKLDRLARGDIDLTIVDGNELEVALGYRDNIRGVFPVSTETGIGWGLRREATQLKAILDRFITQRKLTEFSQPLRTGDLPEIKRSRTLRVATRNSAANYFVWRGQLLGFEYELAKRFAEELGVRLEIVVADPQESLRDLVRSGRADMAAAFLTPRSGRDEGIAWSRPYHFAVKRVVTDAGDSTIDSIEDLSGRRIHVARDSAAWRNAERLRDERGIDLGIEPLPAGTTPEAAIRGVARDEFDLTLVDDHIARNAAAWRENVQSYLEIGDPVPHQWAFREENGQLQAAADRFLDTTYRSEFYNVVYSKYFRDHDRIREFQAQRVDLDGGQQLSPWDDIIQRYAKSAGFDWRLVAAQMFQESGFNPNARSWVGARGLMQIMPATARQVGVTESINDPEVNIRAGIQYLDWLRDRFEEDLRVQDRMWFTLAAFNAGIGHVRDARRLADRLGLNRDRWFDNVEQAMLKLSQPKYYRNARFGYVRGHEPVQYVRAIRERYQAYILWTNDCWPSCQPSPHPTIADFREAATPFGPGPARATATSTTN
jgi:membrane-bound lytic murein transglycosylase F